ncbi:MAG: hypothetical protein ACUVX1_16800 [Chloroflexota bacterium]
MKRFLWLMVVAVVAFPICMVLHNAVSAILGIEEPVFFVLAVIVAPLAFAVGLIGVLASLLRRQFGRA